MVFKSPEWVPSLPFSPPDSLPIHEFMQRDDLRPVHVAKRQKPFTCGVTGKTYSHHELYSRAESLARSLAKAHQWSPTTQTPWDKVVCIYSLNTIDYMTAAYAVHRLSGIVTPANAVYTAHELSHQLESSGAKAMFTCASLLGTATEAATKAGIDREQIYLFSVPGEPKNFQPSHKTLEELIDRGSPLAPLPDLRFGKGQGAEQTAFLCYSSGTSGQPKAVMISHYNVIANILQTCAYESVGRAAKGVSSQVLLAPLPMSHIYSLVVAAHVAVWRGDGYVVLPKYEFEAFLKAIQRFKVEQILVVPPILLQMIRFSAVCKEYDLSSVRFLFSGAAPLGREPIEQIKALYPKWEIAQAYGMTETAVCVSVPSEHDIVPQAAGSLLPGISVKLINDAGEEITERDSPGEIFVKSPSVVLGYLNNPEANKSTFIEDKDGRWMRTGDVGVLSRFASGNEQLVIVDRIKELIKVMGHQVAPAELEAHLLAHPSVADCAVIAIPDEKAGESPRAYVVRSSAAGNQSDEALESELKKWVTDQKAPYKGLRGGVQFVEVVPKSPTGKILRRELRDREAKKSRLTAAKL